jgi:hypothetical protein
MELVRKGGAQEVRKAPAALKFVHRCPHDGAERDTPGPCPKCGMALDEKHKVVKESAPATERRIYVCDLHPEEVSDQPGQCFKESCAGMILEERKLPPGAKLVYVCPDHPEAVSDKPGTCPKDGKKLRFKVVSDVSRTADAWVCPMHPEKKGTGKRKCPDCGGETKHVENEELLSVPFNAVIDTGLRRVVFLERGHGVFESVEVKLGPRAGEWYPVLKGLVVGDRVATNGAFLLDAETRLNPAAAAAYFGAADQEKKK